MTRSKLLYVPMRFWKNGQVVNLAMLHNGYVLIDAKNATLSAVGQVYTDCRRCRRQRSCREGFGDSLQYSI
jgi:hypothetical protein